MTPQAPEAPAAIFAFLPLFLIGVLLAIFIFRLAKRKGRSSAFALLAIVPLVNVLVAIWLASLTDRAVLDQLEELKRKNA